MAAEVHSPTRLPRGLCAVLAARHVNSLAWRVCEARSRPLHVEARGARQQRRGENECGACGGKGGVLVWRLGEHEELRALRTRPAQRAVGELKRSDGRRSSGTSGADPASGLYGAAPSLFLLAYATIRETKERPASTTQKPSDALAEQKPCVTVRRTLSDRVPRRIYPQRAGGSSGSYVCGRARWPARVPICFDRRDPSSARSLSF